MSSEIVRKMDEAEAQVTAPGAPYEIVTETVNGIDYRAYRNAPCTLLELFEPAQQFLDKEFVVYEGERWTFADLLQQAASIGHQLLHRFGLKKGERVAIAMRNYPEWLSAYVGITSVGLVVVPINSWGQRDELEYGISDCGAAVVFFDQQRFDFVADDIDRLGCRAVVARPNRKITERHAWSLEAFLTGAEKADMPKVEIDPFDNAMILYTSGTTGRPKGAVSTHHALCQAIYNFECGGIISAMSQPEPIERMIAKGFEPCVLLAVPLFHVSGLHSVFLLSLRAGRRIVILYKWDVQQALESIERERVTMVSAVPSMVMDLLHSELWDKYDTSSLFSIGGGGTASPPDLADLIRQRCPDAFPGTGWGMTETNAIGTQFTGALYRYHPNSGGRPHPIVEIEMRDDDGKPMPHGEPGRIWIKAVTHVHEYWGRPDATAESIRDGWLDSGDIGYFDDERFIYISDRAKDMVIRGGENIYCAEIEAVIHEHPDVRDVAAFGVPHKSLGEELAVKVIPMPGATITELGIREHIASRLAAFKVPAYIEITDQPFPRNATGKILKRQIRDAFVTASETSA